MRINLSVFFLCFIILVNKAKTEKFILEITDANYSKLITDNKSNKVILLLFYESSCLKCKRVEAFFNEIINISEEMHLSNVIFAKLNGFTYNKLAELHGVTDFPVVKFIWSKYKIESTYNGLINREAIINYLAR